MTGFLLTLLFIASAALAIASIADSLHRHGPAALRLIRQSRECPEWRDVRSTVTMIEVGPASAKVVRPDFRAWAAKAPGRPLALRAAA